MSHLDRRIFLKSGGSLIVGFSLGSTLLGQGNLVPASRAPIPGPPDPKMVDTWLAVHADNTATFYIGFAELGQGASTALIQIAAEELDLDMDQLRTVRLDTSITPTLLIRKSKTTRAPAMISWAKRILRLVIRTPDRAKVESA